ncbi:MAG TPA: HEAT repeat domain-containing protein [Thermomicrobiales bacterium]|nr:HEAT repeat domain-containing protein [Thermomicrobiales bacterium]
MSLYTPHEHAPGTSGAVEAFLKELKRSDSEVILLELLSDLDRDGARRLRDEWQSVPAATRTSMVRSMVEDAERDVAQVYGRVMHIALDDPEPETRLAALRGLWEHDAPGLLGELLNLASVEKDSRVREALAEALAPYAERVGADELETHEAARLRVTLLDMCQSDSARAVRRRALETLGYFPDDEAIAEAIQDAFDSGIFEMQVSALRAMGCQSDTRWLPACYGELNSDEVEIRHEAVTAIGKIMDVRSSTRVVDMLADEDADVRVAAILALGAISGPIAINTLRRIIRDEDDMVLVEAADDALSEAQLVVLPLQPPD